MDSTLEKIVEDRYFNNIFYAVLRYYNENKNHLDLHTYAVPYPSFVKLTDISVERVYFKDDIKSEISEFKLDVEAEFTLKGDKFNDYEEDTKRRKFIVTCSGILNNGLKKVKIIDVGEKDSSPYAYKEALSSLLIPYIPYEDLDKRATEFLDKYYPEALKSPTPILVDELMKRMNVHFFHAPLKNKIFGKAFFAESREKIYNNDNEIIEADIPERTILIDPDVYFYRNAGSYNNTVVHECVHIEYHRKFFEIQKLIDSSKKSISCKEGKLPQKLSGNYQKAFDLMEWQACSLTPKILMPAKMFRLKFEELWKETAIDYPNALKGRIMEVVIEKLSDFFNVSKIAVKIRLFDIGIDNAAGTSNYINGKRYPSFYFKSHTLEKNQTFVIDFVDSLIQINLNPELKELSKQGKLAYANGMVVLNDEKYVRVDENGERVLTDYALEHVDECAFIFEKAHSKSSGIYNQYLETICFLCRSEETGSYIQSSYCKGNIHNAKIIQDASEIEDEYSENVEALSLIKKMNGSFVEDFNVLINENQYVHPNGEPNWSMMQSLTLISDKTLKTYAEGTAHPTKSKALAICAGFCLHPRVSYHFLAKAGYQLQSTMNDFDFVYCGLIERHYEEGVEGWNARITASNMPDKERYLLP